MIRRSCRAPPSDSPPRGTLARMLRRILCLAALSLSVLSAQYAGSSACKTCHANVYQRWSKTRMANVVSDPREHPEVIIPDLSKPNPVFAFSKDDVAFVYGSKW